MISSIPVFTIVTILFIIAIVVFSIYMILLDNKEEYEKNHNPIFESKCGAYINSTNYTVPLIRLSIYQDFMVIKGMKAYQITFKKLQGCPINKSDFGPKGIKIIHNNPEVPLNITLWVNDIDRIKEIICKQANIKMVNDEYI